MQIDAKVLSLFLGNKSLSLFLGTTAIVSGNIVPGGPITVRRAGLMVAKTRSAADPIATRLGVLTAKALHRAAPPPQVTRLGVLIAKTAATSN